MRFFAGFFGGHSSKRRDRWARLVFFVLALPIALAPTELFVRAFKGVGPARTDSVQPTYMPIRVRGGYHGTVLGLPYNTNRYGFRGEPDFPVDPEPGEFRVLSLGDSVGIGLGIEASDSYVKVIERQLSVSIPGLRVINAAGQGYSPSSYLAFLKHDGMRLQPRAVLVEIELCNDVTDEALLGWTTDRGGQLETVLGGRYVVAWDGNLLGTVAVGPPYFSEKTYTYTLLLRRILDKLFQWFPTEPFHSREGVTYFNLGFDRYALDETSIEGGWNRLFKALEQTHGYLAERKVPFLLAILPSRYVFQAPSPQRDFARSLLERAVKMADARDIPHVEVEEELAAAGGADLYFDFAHPNQVGNRVIGAKLASRLGVLLR